jgi:Xaa-Pro aminopeptidase
MPDVVILGDTVRSQELRHELPITFPDPVLYIERDGVRHVVGSSLEETRILEAGDFRFHPFEEFGLDELRRSGMRRSDMLNELFVRATGALGVSEAAVPATFPLLAADGLRAAGIEVACDQKLFDERRRVKTAAQLEGVRRAQVAAEAAMLAARDLLRRAEPDASGVLQLEGRPLRSEDLKAAISAALLAHGASSDELIASHGAQSAIGHHGGEGEIRAGETIVIDIFPRDDASACFADMTRTFVVGEVPAEVAEWHRLCKAALDGALAATAPGVSGRSLFDASCEVFEAAGFATQRTKPDGESLDHGFYHSLGHGVGLAVHEEPLLGLIGHEPLVAGDVITLEPGLYRPGFGGVRLEDLVLVTGTGAENLTRFPYELSP